MKLILTEKDMTIAIMNYLETLGIDPSKIVIGLKDMEDIVVDVAPMNTKPKAKPSKTKDIKEETVPVEEVVEELVAQTEAPVAKDKEDLFPEAALIADDKEETYDGSIFG